MGLDKSDIKKCSHCGFKFAATDAVTPLNWQDLVKTNQNEFKDSGFDILVATKGFGMGIDKSSVRFIVHTSLSSGLESWYQEVGRAGRDNERAHIVLLVDPPNESCRHELLDGEIKRPRCSYRGGCPHGRESLCDYGKQHMFIAGSYPGAESDAVSALRVLDKLIVAREESNDGSIVLSVSNTYLSRTELSVYRLMILGLVEDYAVTYRPNHRFNVEFLLPEFSENPHVLSQVQKKMQDRLANYFSHFKEQEGNKIKSTQLRDMNYQPLEKFATKTRKFQKFEYYEQLFQIVYQHLLLLLHHTYKDVVKMRYDMLWNLLAVINSNSGDKGARIMCRREPLLQHFVPDAEKIRYEKYQCGLCDVCVKTLEFTQEITNQPNDPPSDIRKEAQLSNLLSENKFDLEKLKIFVEEFRDYPSSKYRQGRQVLEGAPNNLPALFLTREFSPSEEYKGNAKRLLRTANQKPLPLSEVAELFKSSKSFESELLLTLNEAGTACDTLEGWKFLSEQAMKPEKHWNTKVVAMRECLDFMLFAEEDLSDKTESLRRKARELEDAFYA